MAKPPGDPWARFCLYVDQNGPIPSHRPELGPCWIWTLSTFQKRGGYGKFRLPGRKTVYAHRFALEKALGRSIRDGLCACHHCDNPLCVRGSHLFEGTRAANNADMTEKGRVAKGDRHSSVTRPDCVPRGEAKSSAKLTEHEVREIRAAIAFGELQKTIAMRYGVIPQTISQIARGKTWRHVEGL